MRVKSPWLCHYWRRVARDAVKVATRFDTATTDGKLRMTATFNKERFKQVLLDSGRHNRKVRKMIKGL